jgi:hypothetical protein
VNHLARWMAVCVLTLLLVGCGQSRSPNPGEWNRSQVEAWVREKLPLTEFQLAPGGEKDHTATGRDAEGKDYEIRLKQTANSITCEFDWKNASGKGNGSFSQSYSEGKKGP